jgi:hypothetical protein
MDIGICCTREIEVDDMLDKGDIETTSSHVGGD